MHPSASTALSFHQQCTLNSLSCIDRRRCTVFLPPNQVEEWRECCMDGEFFDLVAEMGGLLDADALPLALVTFSQMCDGVAHAHEHGLVHGQIRPEHILKHVDQAKVRQGS